MVQFTVNQYNKAQAGTAYMIRKGIAEALPILDAEEEFSEQLRRTLKDVDRTQACCITSPSTGRAEAASP